jgi:glycosyltransferase involved in cell wall biosynthesis
VRIFYVTNGQHVAGGQLVNLDHVSALRRLGYDARFLIVRPPDEGPFTPEFPAGHEAPWQTDVGDLTAADIVVGGEMFALGALAVQRTPARRVLHNQGPYYSFMAFLDLAAIREWGCEAMILPSGFGADMLRRMGWDRGLHVVRPPLDPVFAAAAGQPRELRIAAITSKRLQEIRLIRGILRSQRPELAAVPWLEIAGVSRAEAAQRMATSEIFLAAGQLEGLGLPPLEAMATGALVVGFHGGGGQEYATPENGDWFDDGRHFEIAAMLAQRLDALKAGDPFEARRAAGRATAAGFSQVNFEAQLAAAWRAIAGPP